MLHAILALLGTHKSIQATRPKQVVFKLNAHLDKREKKFWQRRSLLSWQRGRGCLLYKGDGEEEADAVISFGGSMYSSD